MTSGNDDPPTPSISSIELKPRRRNPLFGAMKGTFTVAEGVDLTQPACPEWADIIEDPEWGTDCTAGR